jgi:hypothetical protein
VDNNFISQFPQNIEKHKKVSNRFIISGKLLTTEEMILEGKKKIRYRKKEEKKLK